MVAYVYTPSCDRSEAWRPERWGDLSHLIQEALEKGPESCVPVTCQGPANTVFFQLSIPLSVGIIVVGKESIFLLFTWQPSFSICQQARMWTNTISTIKQTNVSRTVPHQWHYLLQGSSTLVPLAFWVKSCPVHYSFFSSIPGPHLLDTSSISS